jgi:hypothetical protein
VELSLDSEEEYNVSDTEDKLEFIVKAPHRMKKKVKFDVKEVPGAPAVQPPTPTPIDTLMQQMEDLWPGQVTLLRKLSAVRSMNTGTNQGNGNFSMNNGGPMNSNQGNRNFNMGNNAPMNIADCKRFI